MGAGSIVVDAFRTYVPTGAITQAWFGQAPTQAQAAGPAYDAAAFMNLAVSPAGQLNAALAAKLAGLMTDGLAPAFHLRPGVEIDSPTQSAGLTVSGDLDLSTYRYQSVAVAGRTPAATEPGDLVIRAGDGLTVLGSINDGFSNGGSSNPLALLATVPGGSAPVLHTFWELARPSAPDADGSLALSWSIRLVAGADLQAADSRVVLPSDRLAAAAPVAVPGSAGATDPAGSIELYDPHSQPVNSLLDASTAASQLPGWSVIRTGTGNLDVLAGGSVDERSTYAIYTAGAVSQLASNSEFNLPRGTVTTAATLSVTLKSTTVGTKVIPVGTVLSDGITKFTTTRAVTLRGVGATNSIPVTAQGSVPSDKAGTALTIVSCPGCTFALSGLKVTTTSDFGSTPTVLGANGRGTNGSNGVAIESLVANYNAWYPQGGGNVMISAGSDIAGYLPTPINSASTGVLPIDGVGNW
ncbi:MAG TPA: hypothetical protein VGD84_00305, partial [Pseudonocardiaceae bacterium]